MSTTPNNQHTIGKVLDLEQIDRDIFRGPVVPSLFTRTFGGQVAAQALVAATRTASEEYRLHSLHSYFLRPGNPTIPTIFEVDRLRDGNSFQVRHIRGIQNGQEIFTMHASFHLRGDQGPEHSDDMREVPDPETLPAAKGLTPEEQALLNEWIDFDIRLVDPRQYKPNQYAKSQQLVWFKSKHALPDDENFHLCTLTYMSDMTLLHSALVPHRETPVQMASLDHAVWFLRPFRADEWLLYDQISPSAHGGRGLTHGRLFNRAGELVAVVTQEGLTRFLKEGQQVIPVK